MNYLGSIKQRIDLLSDTVYNEECEKQKDGVNMEQVKKENKQSQYSMKYDNNNCKKYYLKLNKRHDGKLIEKLSAVGNVQGYLKSLIEKDLGE